MSVIERIPTGHRGQVTALAAAAALWVGAYELNGHLWNWLLYDGLGMNPAARLTGTLHFFFYDSVKIALLLVGIIFIVTVLRSYMSVERTRALLGGRREGAGNVMAAGLGVVDPVLLVQRRACLHRIRRRRRPHRRDAELPDLQPDGQRGRHRHAADDVRLADRGHLHRRRPDDRRRGRLDTRTPRGAALGRAVRLRDPPRRPARRPVRRADRRPAHPDGRRRGRLHPAQDLALPARRHRARCGHPRLGAHLVLHQLRRRGQRLRRSRRRRDRGAAVLQRRRDHAAGARAARKRACRWALCWPS